MIKYFGARYFGGNKPGYFTAIANGVNGIIQRAEDLLIKLRTFTDRRRF
jgi:hypothetical protein